MKKSLTLLLFIIFSIRAEVTKVVLENSKNILLDAVGRGDLHQVQYLLQFEISNKQLQKVSWLTGLPQKPNHDVGVRLILPNEISIKTLEVAIENQQYRTFKTLVSWYLSTCSSSSSTIVCIRQTNPWLDFEKELLLKQIYIGFYLLILERKPRIALFVLSNGHPQILVFANILCFLMIFFIIFLIKALHNIIKTITQLISDKRLYIFKLAVSENIVDIPYIDQRRNCFIQAASQGFLDIVKYLRKEHCVEVDSWDGYGNTAFMIACANGHFDVVHFLSEEGAKMDYRDRDGRGPLLLAAKGGHAEIVKFLIDDMDQSVYQRDSHGLSACALACETGNLETLEILLIHIEPLLGDNSVKLTLAKQKKLINPLVSVDGTSAITIASINGHMKLVDSLVRYISVNAKSKRGTTALMESIRCEKYESASILLRDFSADPNIMDNNGISALMQCCLDNDDEGLLLLLDNAPTLQVNAANGEGITALMMAASENQINHCHLLLQHEADVNQVDQYGWNCLFYAIHYGASEDLVKLLIDYGVALDWRDIEDGWSALHLATSNWKLFQAILEYIDVKIPSRQLAFNIMHKKTRLGSSVLHLASQGGHLETLKYIIRRQDFDLNEAITTTGWRPLHFASHQGHLDCVKALVDAGAQIKVFDEDGSSPFNVAVQVGQVDIVKYYLKHQKCKRMARNDSSVILSPGDLENEFDILNETDNDGWKPILWACDKGHLAIVKAIVEEDLSCLSVRDNDGWTPLMIACMEGHLDIVKFLLSKGASLDDVDQNGWDCITFASENNRFNVLKYLSTMTLK